MALAIAMLARGLLADPSALPAPQSTERINPCPTRYLSQGRYCLHGRDVPFVIYKRAHCSASYLPQGSY